MNLKLGLRGLSILDKISKGACALTCGTDNPKVPGNGPVLAAFQTQQERLVALQAEVGSLEVELRAARARVAEQEKVWDSAYGALGIFTESATAGEPDALFSAGFDVRRKATALPAVEAPEKVTVEFTERPGESLIAWKRPKGAASFVVQWSADLGEGASWHYGDTVTDTQARLSVTQPGQCVWFRVAAVSARGTGPWSTPAARPVL